MGEFTHSSPHAPGPRASVVPHGTRVPLPVGFRRGGVGPVRFPERWSVPRRRRGGFHGRPRRLPVMVEGSTPGGNRQARGKSESSHHRAHGISCAGAADFPRPPPRARRDSNSGPNRVTRHSGHRPWVRRSPGIQHSDATVSGVSRYRHARGHGLPAVRAPLGRAFRGAVEYPTWVREVTGRRAAGSGVGQRNPGIGTALA